MPHPPAPSNAARRQGRVLVLGDDTRSFLTTVRSLGRQGIEVEVVPSDLTQPALRSRYIMQVHQLPPHIGDGADWLSAARRLLSERSFDLVIPCDDRNILPFHLHRAELALLARLAIPDAISIDLLFDKEKTKALAASVGVNLARTEALKGIEPTEVLARLGSPVVIKPKQSYRIDALDRRATVRMVDTAEELARLVREQGTDGCYAEEFFQGTGVGVSVLADRGQILAAFEHHRVHEPARGGGASAFRVSAPLSPDLVQACERMLKAIGYTGVAMFEFRRNFATGAWILLEVNARPWGSMPLPVGLGVDFPYRWYQLLVEGSTKRDSTYRTGIYGRNLILDIRFAISTVAEAHGAAGKIGAALRWLASFRHLLAGRERSDTITPDDREPGLAELRQLAATMLAKIGRRLPFALDARRSRARRRLRSALQAPPGSAKSPAVVFVCYGNICRSVFAEHLLARRIAGSGGVGLPGSAGTYAVTGRRSPDTAIAVAKRFGIELDAHRSRYLTDALARSAAAILVFDESNEENVLARFPDLAERVIRLSLLAPRGTVRDTIADPYGGDETVYQRAYEEIAAAVEALHALLPPGER